MMRRRLLAGGGADGGHLPDYSPLYRLQRAAIAKATTINVNDSGRTLADLQALRIEITGDRVTIVFGAGTSTSARTPRPPPWAFSTKQTPEQQAKALERWRASSKKPAQSLPHNQVLEQLIRGGVGRPARDILGLTPADRRAIARMLEKVAIFRSG